MLAKIYETFSLNKERFNKYGKVAPFFVKTFGTFLAEFGSNQLLMINHENC